MADRSLTVRMRGEFGDYIAGLSRAGAATKNFAADSLSSVEKSRAAWGKVGTTMTVAGLAIAAGLGVAVKHAMDFDRAMSEVGAATQASAGDLQQLRDAAMQAGQDTAFSATEAAQGITELAKAGVSTADILGGALTGALDLAAAGQLDVADAAEIAATALVQFKLSGDQLPHVADLLAAGAGKAQGSVGDMGAALKQAGLVASQTGLSIEETSAGLAAFAAAGLVGSDAGTSFKSMLQRLTPQSAEAQRTMDELGISAYDAQGNFIGLEAFAGNLRQSLSGLTTEQRQSALATIFGSDAVRAAAVLYDQGAEGIKKWTSEVNDAGYASEYAATLTDNLGGDLERLGGSLDTLFIKTGSGINSSLRGLAQGLEGVVNWVSELPAPVQDAGVKLAALAAGALLFGGASIKAVTSIASMREALVALNLTAGRTGVALGAIGKTASFVGVTATVAMLANAVEEWAGVASVADVAAEDLASSLRQVAIGAREAGAFGELFSSGWGPFRTEVTQTSVALEEFGNMARGAMAGGFWADFQRGLQGGAVAGGRFNEIVSQLDAQLAALANSGSVEQARAAFDRLMSATGLQGDELERLKAQFPQYAAAVSGAGAANAGAAAPIEDTRSAMQKQADAATEATTSVQDYVKALMQIANPALAARQAEIDWIDSLAAATAAAKSNSAGLDLNSDAGRRNNEAMLAAANAAFGMAEGMAGMGASVPTVNQHLKASYEALVTQAMQFGRNREQAEEYVNQLTNWPAVVHTMVTAETEAAQGKIDEVKTGLDNIDGSTATGTADVNSAPAQQELTSASANLARYGTQVGTATADANDQPAQASIAAARGTLAQWGTSWGTAIAAANNQPALASIGAAQGTLSQWGRSTGTSTAAANNRPAFSDLAAARAALSAWGNSSGTARVNANTSQATGALAYVASQLRSIDGYVAQTQVRTVYTTIRRNISENLDAGAARNPLYQSAGGYITGPGTKTSDSIPAYLSTGEYVVRAAAVDKYGVSLLHAINAMRFADGGLVPTQPMVAAPAAASSAPSSVSVSLDGGSISGTLRMRGDGLVDLIDGRISHDNKRRSIAMLQGA